MDIPPDLRLRRISSFFHHNIAELRQSRLMRRVAALMFEVIVNVLMVIFIVTLEMTEPKSQVLVNEKHWSLNVLKLFLVFRLGILFFKIMYLESTFAQAGPEKQFWILLYWLLMLIILYIVYNRPISEGAQILNPE